MSKTQLGLLFTIGLIFWTISNGMLPLLPVYSLQLGAAVSFAGTFLSFSFLMLTISTLLTGWLADKYQYRKAMFIGAGTLFSLALALMSRATDEWQFAVFTSIAWFLFGMGVALINIFAGASAGKDERGKVFGILALTGGFGLLIGGLLLGRLADAFGYPALLLMLAGFALLWPILGIFVRDEYVGAPDGEKAAKHSSPLGKPLWLFLGSFTLAWISLFAGRLATSIVMESLGFSSSAISSTSTAAGAITLPLPAILGWLSDRTGRLRIIGVGFLFSTLGLGVLSLSSELPQFWLAAILITTMSTVIGVGFAHITDTAPEESVGVGLSLFQSTAWVAGIVGFLAAGYAIENIGFVPAAFVAAILPLMAIGTLALSARLQAQSRVEIKTGRISAAG
jgi:MFS family permease